MRRGLLSHFSQSESDTSTTKCFARTPHNSASTLSILLAVLEAVPQGSIFPKILPYRNFSLEESLPKIIPDSKLYCLF